MVRSTHPTTNRQPVGVFSAQQSAKHSLSEASRASLAEQTGVGLFSSLSDAEYAVTDFRSVGFPLSQITLVANYFRRRDQFADVELRDRFEALSFEIPAEQVSFYQAQLGRGKYMLIVQGTEDELNRAASMLKHRKIQEWCVYTPVLSNRERHEEVNQCTHS